MSTFSFPDLFQSDEDAKNVELSVIVAEDLTSLQRLFTSLQNWDATLQRYASWLPTSTFLLDAKISGTSFAQALVLF